MRSTPKSLEFLRKTLHIAGAGDRTWALAAHIAGVGPTEIDYISKDPLYGRLPSFGGDVYHVHYINWNDELLVQVLEAWQFGVSRDVSLTDVETLKGRTVHFGRGAGAVVNTFTFEAEGIISGEHHDNESLWVFENALVIKHKNGTAMSRLDRLFELSDGRLFFTGPFLGGGKVNHFITLKEPDEKRKS